MQDDHVSRRGAADRLDWVCEYNIHFTDYGYRYDHWCRCTVFDDVDMGCTMDMPHDGYTVMSR